MELFKLLFNESLQKTIVIIVSTVISGITGGAIVTLVLNAADDIISGKYYTFYCIILPLIATMLIVSRKISLEQTSIVVENALEKLILKISNNIRHSELIQIEEQKPSDIYMKMEKASIITRAATKNIDLIQNSIIVIFLLFYIFKLSIYAGFFSIFASCFALFIYNEFKYQINPFLHEETNQINEMYNAFNFILYGFKEIKISKSKNDDLFNNYLSPVISNTKNIRSNLIFQFSDYNLFIYVSFFVVIGLNVFIFSKYYPHTIAIKVVIILQFLITPVKNILAAIPNLANGKEALENIFQVAEKSKKKYEIDGKIYNPSKEVIKNFNNIRLDNIHFSYPKKDDTYGFEIGPINLDINSGEIIFIVGGNGSGKSTLSNIITGLYHPTVGVLKIDDINVNMSDHRYLFSTIFSDYHLFDSLYGLDDEIKNDKKKISDLLTQMELLGKTQYENDKFSNITNLSTGQKKRLALIVSILEDKPIYLFDEWAADQAPYFRKYFYEILLPLFKEKGKTMIIITHDDAYFHIADKIIKLEYGKVI